ncbi:response regulator [Thiofaba sp. EF100]|uniref:response regulator n=1 Tax=Thiofaba sp. EF100 TaxID=3121274 RepID=UPI00322146C9
MMPTLWLVDDDAALRDLLVQYLREQGFAVVAFADGPALDRALHENPPPDLLLLDVMLPGEDGLSIARRLGGLGIPIIMLSARGEDIDRIVGLEVGADDYLPKPFNPRELLARIRAVLRRREPNTVSHAAPVAPARLLEQGPFRLDLDTHAVSVAGRPVELTEGEFQLLRIFLEQPRRLLSRDALLERLKGYERSPFDRSIDVRVARLRRKIESDPAHPRHLLTIRGEGYVFVPEGRETP